MKVFRIIAEIREIIIGSVCLKTIDYLYMKLFRVTKVQDFGNFELSPMCQLLY